MSTSTRDAAVTTTGDRDCHIERVFDAPRERVWAAYSRVEQLAQWWGRGNRLDIERWEFRKGGHWRFVEHAEGQTHGFEGRFREITPEERIVQSFEWDGMPAHITIDTTTFVDLGDGRTKVVTDSLFHTQEERDGMLQSGMETGLNESYRALDRLLAS
ncbi:SRPBCC family protein [Nocardia sp. NPDC048505]|uniref:SRPBCC family protein n=1 Tax=unclassified Nocardia TaxID=2637762 RepID=UPI003404AD2B